MDLIDTTVDYLHHLAEQAVTLRERGDFVAAAILDEDGRLIADVIREFTAIN